MVDSDVSNYIRSLYNENYNLNKFSGEDSNTLHFPALLSYSEDFLKLLSYQ